MGLLGALSDLDARAILEESEIFVEFKGALACLLYTSIKNYFGTKLDETAAAKADYSSATQKELNTLLQTYQPVSYTHLLIQSD